MVPVRQKDPSAGFRHLYLRQGLAGHASLKACSGIQSLFYYLPARFHEALECKIRRNIGSWPISIDDEGNSEF